MTEVTPNLPHLGNFCKYCFMGTLLFDVPICVSQQFFGWVCGFGGKVEVTAPAAVRAQLHEMLQSLAEQHG